MPQLFDAVHGPAHPMDGISGAKVCATCFVRRCLVQLQGSQCIVLKGSALRQMYLYEKSLSTGSCSHWGLKVWRSFSRSMFGHVRNPLWVSASTGLKSWAEVNAPGQRALLMPRPDATNNKVGSGS